MEGAAVGDVAACEWTREAAVLRWRPLIGRSDVAAALDASDGGRTCSDAWWRSGSRVSSAKFQRETHIYR